MKRSFKYISAMLAALLAAGCCSTAFSAAELEESDSVSAIYQKDENGVAAYYDENGKEIPIESLNDDAKIDNSALPEKYDLRDYGRSSKVKNQGSEGFCWAFGSIASMESSILSQSDLRDELGDNPQDTIDLSEGGQSWFIHTGIPDKNSPFYGDYKTDPYKGRTGGFPNTIADSLNAGYGTYPQELCPYNSAKSGYSEELRFYSDYRLREYNELSNDQATIKNAIMNNGAATIFYSSASACYSADYANFYSNENSPVSNQGHIISVIGWDDNYSKDNFTGYSKPDRDGAWLCKNSWGENYGNNGYIWISYYTTPLSFTQFIMQSNKNFDNVYENTLTSGEQGYNFEGSANVFTANSDEVLKQISISTLSAYKYTASVYELNADYKNPTDGKLLTTFSGEVSYNGIHYIDVPDTVYLSAGEKFSVVVKSDEKDNYQYYSNPTENFKSKSKISYVFTNGSWTDSGSGPAYNRYYSTVKALTSNVDNSELKGKLRLAITDAEKFDKSQTELVYYYELLEEQISKAKAVLENSNSSAQDINNQIILLKYYEKKAINAPYEINSVEDYKDLTELCTNNGEIPDKISLNTDLDLKDYPEGFNPICGYDGEYLGDFIGNGHTIKNITFKAKGFLNNNYSGLLGKLMGGTVSDLTIENAVVAPSSKGGAIAAIAQYATIKNCTVKNSKTEYGYDFAIQSSGALCGEIWDSSVIKCTAENNTIYGTTAGEFCFAVNTNLLDCTAKNNKVYSTGSITVYNQKSYDSTNLYFVSEMNKSDTFVEMTEDYIRVSSLIHKITSCTSDTVKLTQQGDYYYIDADSLGESNFVTVEIDMTDIDSGYKYKVNLEDKSIVLTEITYEPGEIIEIPDIYNGRPVTGITENLFNTILDIGSVKNLVIGNNITELPKNLIKSFYNLESIKFGNSIKEIPSEFASYKSLLKTVDFGTGIEKIGSNAFLSCSSLQGITLPDSIMEIGDCAFSGVNFNKVTLGKNIDKIGKQAFGYFNYILLNKNGESIKNPYYVINGYSSTEAERYAKANGIAFVDMNTQKPDTEQTYTDVYDYRAGDIDLNGSINVNDVTLLQRFIAGEVNINDIQYKTAAVTKYVDTISINNATEIQRYLSGDIDSLDINAQG